jgi:hypothetical protein
MLRMTGDWVNSSSTAKSLRLILPDVLLLNRNSPDFNLEASNGDCGLDLRIVFLGGLGPRGDIGLAGFTSGVPACTVSSSSSNSGPRENEGGSHAFSILVGSPTDVVADANRAFGKGEEALIRQNKN